ncbi:hypothetical protein [Phenylobacterium sp.]|uniref:hypothetical protein n=1 Tax=Phenylobacterium sp. TaxID=1871053 RepID=UPI00121B9834|nr:hypothetical protein [Phenylobacterium sp.]THD64319.1 MAG: hypothetical protein E8A49_02195 [Phenylobacterium sp.]
MRLRILALAATVLAAPASAQMSMGTPGNYAPTQYLPDDRTPPPAYTKAFTALAEKVVHTRAADGGKLTPEHFASLQQELVALNRKYRAHPGVEVQP